MNRPAKPEHLLSLLIVAESRGALESFLFDKACPDFHNSEVKFCMPSS